MPVRTKKSKLKKILLYMGMLVFVGGLLAYVGLWAALNGGVGGLYRNLKPNVNVNSANVITKRETAVDEINKSFETDIDGGIFKEYATSTHDRCHRGSNGWKRSDLYSNYCVYRITKFYGLKGDFKKELLNFENELIRLGWLHPSNSNQKPMEYLMTVFDKNYGAKRLYGDGIYYVSNLPYYFVEYTKNGQTLEITLAEKATTDLDDLEYAQNETSGIAVAKETYEEKDFQDIPKLFEDITSQHQYVFVVSIQKKYFEN